MTAPLTIDMVIAEATLSHLVERDLLLSARYSPQELCAVIATANASSRSLRCDRCGTDEGVEVCIDPYDAQVNDILRTRAMCPSCVEEREYEI